MSSSTINKAANEYRNTRSKDAATRVLVGYTPIFKKIAVSRFSKFNLDDFVQEANIQVVTRALPSQSWTEERGFYSFGLVAGVNRMKSLVNYELRRPHTNFDSTHEFTNHTKMEDGTLQLLAAHEGVEDFKHYISDLPPRWEAIARLRIFEDLPYKEVAKRASKELGVHVPVGTVMSTLHRVFKKYRSEKSIADFSTI